jgi:hypothetical protein
MVMTAAEHHSREDNAGFGIGTVAEHWMGCPLFDHNHQVLGAMVIQSYDKEHTFSDEDQALFARSPTTSPARCKACRAWTGWSAPCRNAPPSCSTKWPSAAAPKTSSALYELANLSATATGGSRLNMRLHQIISELVPARTS